MSTFEVYIDRQTGTWGMANDLVIAFLPESRVDDMETMSDSELIELAYNLEDEATNPSRPLSELMPDSGLIGNEEC